MIEVLAKSILGNLASFSSSLAAGYVVEEIKAAKSSKKELKIIADKMEAICAVLEDAEDKGYTNKAIKLWLRDLKSVFYDIDDLLDEAEYDAMLRKANEGHFTRQLRYYASSSNPIISPFVLSHKIKELRESLDNIVAKKDKFGLTERLVVCKRDEIRNPLDGAPVYGRSVVGRNKAKWEILSKVYALSDTTELSVLPIVGMGGIGKTTLAKLVYGDIQHFELKLWVCVSGKFKTNHLLEDIVKAGNGDNTSNQDINTLVTKVQDMLTDKKYFLVLDDVGVEDVAMWTELKDLLAIGKSGTVILITTREANIASITQTMEPYNLEKLPEDDCWSIFEQLAFKEGDEATYPHLYAIGKSIIKKCCGIPLLVTTLGSLLRIEREAKEWQRINEMDSFVQLNEMYDKVMQLLKITYDKLPSHLKPCFAYCSLYVKDVDLQTNYVPYMWSALGLLRARNENKEIEDWGYSYFRELISRSLLQEPSIQIDRLWCQSKMHDLLHDLAMNILGEELSIVTLDKLIVSEFSRHIVWGYEEDESLKDIEFPKELVKAKNVRSFRFNYKVNYISRSFLEGIISHFSCLRILDLSDSWFEELPRSIKKLKHLRYLDLSNNPIIRTLPKKICRLLNLELLCCHGCLQLQEIPKDVFLLQSLRNFTVTTSQMSLVEAKINQLICLHTLWVESCMNLVSLWDNGDVGGLTSLRILQIIDCPNLTRLPNSIKFLRSLEALIIDNCGKLDMEEAEWMVGLQSLRLLHIDGDKKLERLPHGIQHVAASLEYLLIYHCTGLQDLPYCLESFASLCHIEIVDCPKLSFLPFGFCHLKSLQLLEIYDCPSLSERCAEFTGRDYPLIQHIPKVLLDGVEFTGKHFQ